MRSSPISQLSLLWPTCPYPCCSTLPRTHVVWHVRAADTISKHLPHRTSTHRVWSGLSPLSEFPLATAPVRVHRTAECFHKHYWRIPKKRTMNWINTVCSMLCASVIGIPAAGRDLTSTPPDKQLVVVGCVLQHSAAQHIRALPQSTPSCQRLWEANFWLCTVKTVVSNSGLCRLELQRKGLPMSVF